MCHALLAFASKESEMTTITNKKQYPSEQYLNELITQHRVCCKGTS
ncbi:Eaa protein [Escherichia coli]|uniref:Eaa protein n=1 Tax=Escherichia coli TaxID=562 RepID=A0A376D9N7_ECOLX|nr:Eaa protein [Escherichia coli]